MQCAFHSVCFNERDKSVCDITCPIQPFVFQDNSLKGQTLTLTLTEEEKALTQCNVMPNMGEQDSSRSNGNCNNQGRGNGG